MYICDISLTYSQNEKCFRQSCRHNKYTLLCSTTFYENRAVYETIGKNMKEPQAAYNILWRLHIACWITEATATHTEHKILISFPRQQWLRKAASLLCSYVRCLSCLNSTFQNWIVHLIRPESSYIRLILRTNTLLPEANLFRYKNPF